jgi:hypothetical protein
VAASTGAGRAADPSEDGSYSIPAPHSWAPD